MCKEVRCNKFYKRVRGVTSSHEGAEGSAVGKLEHLGVCQGVRL